MQKSHRNYRKCTAPVYITEKCDCGTKRYKTNCLRWNCEVCGPRLLGGWKKNVLKLAKMGVINNFSYTKPPSDYMALHLIDEWIYLFHSPKPNLTTRKRVKAIKFEDLVKKKDSHHVANTGRFNHVKSKKKVRICRRCNKPIEVVSVSVIDYEEAFKQELLSRRIDFLSIFDWLISHLKTI